MKTFLTLTTLGVAAAGPLMAGNLEEATPTPIVEPVAAAPAFGGTWDGFYAGAQLGYGWLDSETGAADADAEDLLGGVHAGWQGSAGQFVYGAEADYNYGELDFGDGTELNGLSHLKARAGYDLGRTLVYATGGAAYADIDNVGQDWGWTAGAGVDYLLTDSVSIGAEALYHSFDDVDDSGTDVEGTTLTAKVSYHF